MKTKVEIEIEIKELLLEEAKMGTEEETVVTHMAAGAIEALRWVAGQTDIRASKLCKTFLEIAESWDGDDDENTGNKTAEAIN